MRVTNKKEESLNHSYLAHFPRSHIVAASALSMVLTLLLSLFPSEDVAAKRHDLPLQLSLPEPQPFDDSLESLTAQPQQLSWNKQTVKSGDSLFLIFQRVGLTEKDLYDLLNSGKEATSLANIYPGQELAFQIDKEGQLQQLRYVENRLSSRLFSRTDAGFNSELFTRKPDVHPAYREATIDSSLFLAGKQAQLDSDLIMEMANIFGWDVDFALDIRQGDSFKLLFEEYFIDGEKVGNGDILAAEFTNQNTTFKAVRYTDKKGLSHYFTPSGESMRKAFIRTPVELARISSHFNLQRKHPVLNRIRAHKGTDYAAMRGTPIKATGDGKVVFAGRKGGYGNVVIIQHGHQYKTLYAHMHKFRRGIRAGTRVKQGQVIGYVGSTGLATGPHLHYEFYINGSVRNPVKVKLPKADAVARSEKIRFLEQTTPIVAKLNSYHNATQIALANAVGTIIN